MSLNHVSEIAVRHGSVVYSVSIAFFKTGDLYIKLGVRIAVGPCECGELGMAMGGGSEDVRSMWHQGSGSRTTGLQPDWQHLKQRTSGKSQVPSSRRVPARLWFGTSLGDFGRPSEPDKGVVSVSMRK